MNLYQDNNGCFKQLSIGADKDLFIIGESYAGKYVPAIAMEIMERKKNGGVIRGLKGVSIGDGFTHPYDILAEVGAFSYNVGLLDYQERSRVEQMIINATYQALSHKWNELHDSFDTILDSIVDWAGGVNVYDFTRYTPYPSTLQFIQTRCSTPSSTTLPLSNCTSSTPTLPSIDTAPMSTRHSTKTS